jgi:hypothetical protein
MYMPEPTPRQKAIVILSEMLGLAADVAAQIIEESPTLQDTIDQGRINWNKAAANAEALLNEGHGG